MIFLERCLVECTYCFDSKVANEGERKDNCVMPLRLEIEEKYYLHVND